MVSRFRRDCTKVARIQTTELSAAFPLGAGSTQAPRIDLPKQFERSGNGIAGTVLRLQDDEEVNLIKKSALVVSPALLDRCKRRYQPAGT